MTVLGYVRQSRRADLDVALSPDQQRQDIERMAARDGNDAVVIHEDLGRSGGAGKEKQRAGYRSVVAAIEAGGVEVVYAKALTRLARSTVELYRLLGVCQERGTRIVTAKEGQLDPTSPMGKAQFGMMAVFAEFERDLAVERARDNVATRRANGERMGRAPYGERPGENPDLVARAFEESRSLNATARRLNEQGIPSPLGKLWNGTSVRNILARSAPDLLPRRASHGVKPSSPFLLYQLLRCACGKLLTASRDNRDNHPAVVYRCHAADTDPAHHRPYRVRESEVMPWIRAEADRLAPDGDALTMGKETSRRRDVLEAQRERLGHALVDGLLTREQAATKATAIDAELATLTDREAIVDIPSSIDWSQPPAKVNRLLRALWTDVRLGMDMRPVEATWVAPDWRRP